MVGIIVVPLTTWVAHHSIGLWWAFQVVNEATKTEIEALITILLLRKTATDI